MQLCLLIELCIQAFQYMTVKPMDGHLSTVYKCQTVAVLLLLSPCIHPVTHEETVILEENVV